MSRGGDIAVSFEIFPANTLQGFRKLNQTCKELNKLEPDFISVTFGAAGSSQVKTLRMVRYLANSGISTMPHISCVNMTKIRLEQLLQKYIAVGIKRLLVVRGDFVGETTNSITDFNYASDLITYIRLLTGNHFHIAVAAYPELHPASANSDDDLLHFKNKIEAGANSAITQFFFNSDAYFHFRENCEKIGIKVPIIPGIMPILNYERLLRISNACGAEIPLWLRRRLESFSGDFIAIKSLGVDVITKLCERLLLEDVPGLHFYTLDQVNPVTQIYRNLFVDDSCTEFLQFCMTT